jgi:elongation factor G
MNGSQVKNLLSIRIHAAGEQDREELKIAADAFVRQNPGRRINIESLDACFVLHGEDEMELEAICTQLQKLRVIESGPLKIGYRETIRKAAEAEGKYIRQTGGSGNYGHCKLRIEPNPKVMGYAFSNDIQGAGLPPEFVEAIDQGVQGALQLGILAGYPIVDVKVTLFDGSFHEVDSNEMAFKFAGSIAFKEAARKASPVLLEPIMAVEVTVPEEFLGTVIGDINSRRGRIESMEFAAGSQAIKARIPLAELLRSSAHGRPAYAMHFAGYEEVSRFHGSGGDDAAVPAVKPRGPKPRKDSETAGL